jgi:hypothetical protein
MWVDREGCAAFSNCTLRQAQGTELYALTRAEELELRRAV